MRDVYLLLASVTLLMQCVAAYAGEDFLKNKSAGGYYHYGYMWGHKPRVEHLTTGHSQGAEFFFQTQTDGSKWWHRVHGYPQTGFSIMYFDFANPQVVGTATAVISYINMPLVRSRNFLFSFQTGAGLGYLSKRFDTVDDYKNMAIGSHINAAIRVHFLTRFQITENIFFHLNYGITHFSNGSFRLPNFGINNISLSGGLSYAFNPAYEFLKPEIPPADKRMIIEAVYGTGVKENYPPDGNQFFAHTFYLQFLKPLGHTSRIALGADVFYDLSLSRFIDSVPASEEHVKIIRSGIHLGYEMPINKIILLIHMGYYLLDETKFDGSFYHRYGIKYQVGKRLFINLSLKSHWARADYFELGIGWKIK
jgi:hypothetical protein